MMHIYGKEDGPSMMVELPVKTVETLIDVVYHYITPGMGLDQAFTDELREQLSEYRKEKS